MLNNLNQYIELNKRLSAMKEADRIGIMRQLVKQDIFFFLTTICGRRDIFHPWLLERCRDVQNNPDGYLDLWARDHRKSTIITFAKTIQDILNNPEITVAIFSHSAKIATPFLLQIRQELTDNELLKELFPDVLWREPHREAPFWNSDRLVVKRANTSTKEATLEAHGVVENQPTSKHFRLCVYDDMVTPESVTSPEMIDKTTKAWEMSLNLGMNGGIRRYIGTFYHFNDTYHTMISRKAAIPRIHPATNDGTPYGKPVFLTDEEWQNKINDYGGVDNYILSCQLLLNPVSGKNAAFKKEDLRFFYAHEQKRQEIAKQMNVYIWVDPARTKKVNSENKKGSDYTAMAVIGANQDNNYYLLDIVRSRLNLQERSDALFELVKKWKPLKVGYEKNSAEADIDFIRTEQQRLNFRFGILDKYNTISKQDKIISTLQPVFGRNRFYLPQEIFKENNETGEMEDLIKIFIESEYIFYPFAPFDDLLDSMASCIKFLEIKFPLSNNQFNVKTVTNQNPTITESMKRVTAVTANNNDLLNIIHR